MLWKQKPEEQTAVAGGSHVTRLQEPGASGRLQLHTSSPAVVYLLMP